LVGQAADKSTGLIAAFSGSSEGAGEYVIYRKGIDRGIPSIVIYHIVADGEGNLWMGSERGILRGELGQPFFFPDPRRPERLVAIAGARVIRGGIDLANGPVTDEGRRQVAGRTS